MNQPAPQLTASPRTFTQLLSSSRRGARLARLLTVSQLHSWGAHRTSHSVLIVVAELAANSVLPGGLPGRSPSTRQAEVFVRAARLQAQKAPGPRCRRSSAADRHALPVLPVRRELDQVRGGFAGSQCSLHAVTRKDQDEARHQPV